MAGGVLGMYLHRLLSSEVQMLGRAKAGPGHCRVFVWGGFLLWDGSSSGPSLARLPGLCQNSWPFLTLTLGPAKSPESPLLPWGVSSTCSSSPTQGPSLRAVPRFSEESLPVPELQGPL